MDAPVLTGIVLTLVATGAALGWLAWRRFRKVRVAPKPEPDGIQETTILVRNGYHPDTIHIRAGRPVRLVFQRAEDDPCSARVYLTEPPLSRYLPAFAATAIVFTPDRVGSHLFTCEEGRFRGRLIVEPLDPARRRGRVAATFLGWCVGALGLRDAAVHAQQGRAAPNHMEEPAMSLATPLPPGPRRHTPLRKESPHGTR